MAAPTPTKGTDSGDSSKKRRLGRGLSSLISSPVAVEVPQAVENTLNRALSEPIASEQAPQPPIDDSERVHMIPVDRIAPNPAQPRRRFNEEALAELAASIRSAGVMQPIIVRRVTVAGRAGERFELVAGERRWRAAQLASLAEVPALVRDLTDAESAQWALIENLQREDLGPMEKAGALRSLVQSFGLTHAEVAQRVGLERATISNLLRLLELEEEIADALEQGDLTMGHGRALLAVPAGPVRLDLAHQAIANQWSVRRLEREAAEAVEIPTNRPGGAGGDGAESLLEREAGVRDLERRLSEHLGTRVKLLLRRGGTRGRIVVEFYDLDQFDGLMARIGFDAK